MSFGAGPIVVCGGGDFEQPLPSGAASNNTENRPSANIQIVTQPWFCREQFVNVLELLLKSRPGAVL